MPAVGNHRRAAALRQLKRRLSELQVDEEVFGDYLLGMLCDAVHDEGDQESSVDAAVEFLVSACNDAEGAQKTIEELWDNLTSDSCHDSLLDTEESACSLCEEDKAECRSAENTLTLEEGRKLFETAIEKGNLTEDSPVGGDHSQTHDSRHLQHEQYPLLSHWEENVQDQQEASLPENSWYTAKELYPEITGEFAEWLAHEDLAGADEGFVYADTDFELFEAKSGNMDYMNSAGITLKEENMLLSLFNKDDLAKRAHQTNGTASDSGQRPCIFFLSGSCLRADCSFSHDMSLITCRYWAAGGCLKGASCPFMHKFQKDSSAVQQDREDVALGPDDFPELSTCQKTRETQAAYGSADKPMFNDLVKRGMPVTMKETSKSLSGGGASGRSTFGRKAAHVSWVATGDVVGHQYSELRHGALQHGSLRNKYFQQATQAYFAGDKAAAKHLSRRGRYHDRQMRLMNEQAARETVKLRNKEHAKNVLDLHGLHIQEALSCMDYFLSLEHSEQHVYLITGTGHHSVQTRYQPRLQPAVIDHIHELGLTFRDCSSDGRGGMLEVVLRN